MFWVIFCTVAVLLLCVWLARSDAQYKRRIAADKAATDASYGELRLARMRALPVPYGDIYVHPDTVHYIHDGEACAQSSQTASLPPAKAVLFLFSSGPAPRAVPICCTAKDAWERLGVE